ncbi:MAG: GntR family transcriptional regulator, partial [Candidatus Promineifilaceae bacterium]
MELHLELEHDSTVPLYRQLYEQIRNLILDGAIEPGTKLPPSRHVAQSHRELAGLHALD